MFALFCFLAIIVGTAVTQSNRLPPVISGLQSTDGTEQLAPGASLNLICSADYPVEWILPNNSMILNYSNPQTDGRLTRNTNEQLSSGYFQAEITVVQLKITDTGFYLCRAALLTDQPLAESSSSSSSNAFLFINDEKLEHSLLAWKIDELSIMSVGRQVIPCRTTTLDANVMLYIDGDRQPQLVQESYDPRIGFTVAASQLTIYGTSTAHRAECRAKTNYGTNSFPFVLTIIEQDNSNLISNSISNSISNGTSVDNDVPVTKEIVVQPTSNADQTVNEGGALSLFVTFQAESSRYTKTWYKTTVSALYGISKVELKFDSRIRSLLQSDGGGGSSMEMFTEKIDIDDAIIEDSGTYTLKLIADGGLTKSFEWNVLVKSDKISSDIRVTQPTNITASVDTHFLQLNGTYKIICSARGLPLPSIAIQRMPCIHECSDHQREDVPDGSVSVLTGTFEIAKVLHWNAQQSFTYQCLVNGSDGTTSASSIANLIVTDVVKSEENLGMDVVVWSSASDPTVDDAVPNETYENDRMVLVCRVQKYAYGMITWWLVDTNSSQETLIANAYEWHAGYNGVYNTSGAFSNRLELHFDPLHLNTSGLYRCMANLKIAGGPQKREQLITVKKIEKPSFRSKDDYSPPNVEANHEEQVILYCSAEGTPRPRIDWYKDGKELEVTTGTFLSADHRNLTITSVLSRDQGVYACKVYNRAGFIWNNMTLTVVGEPTLLSKDDNLLVIGAIAGGALLLLSIIICICVMLICQAKRRRKQRRHLDNRYMNSSVEQMRLDPDITLSRQEDDVQYGSKYESPSVRPTEQFRMQEKEKRKRTAH